MFKKYYEGIQGIEIYPMILLIVFVSFFVSMSIWLFFANKKKMETLSKIPFDLESDSKTDSQKTQA